MTNCCDSAGRNYHCARCHQTFTSLTNFDRHQDVDYDRPQHVLCVAPDVLGLVQDHKGIWCTKEAASSRLASSQRAAALGSRSLAANAETT